MRIVLWVCVWGDVCVGGDGCGCVGLCFFVGWFVCGWCAAGRMVGWVCRFDSFRGFRRVFGALAARNIPIVGHNVMYDLLFMMAHFEQPLTPPYVTSLRP